MTFHKKVIYNLLFNKKMIKIIINFPLQLAKIFLDNQAIKDFQGILKVMLERSKEESTLIIPIL